MERKMGSPERTAEIRMGKKNHVNGVTHICLKQQSGQGPCGMHYQVCTI